MRRNGLNHRAATPTSDHNWTQKYTGQCTSANVPKGPLPFKPGQGKARCLSDLIIAVRAAR
jgi:hypothetical protein